MTLSLLAGVALLGTSLLGAPRAAPPPETDPGCVPAVDPDAATPPATGVAQADPADAPTTDAGLALAAWHGPAACATSEQPARVVPISRSSRRGWFTVASFNVLGASHTLRGKRGMASGARRTLGVVRLLNRHRADIVGFQELQRPQYVAFRKRVGHRYAVWHPGTDTDNAVAWRRDRFRLVKARSLRVPYFEGRVRRMPVLRLRDRHTGKAVAVLNVHNPADTRQYPRQGRWRRVAVSREVALVRWLARRNRTPVLVTGDMNDRRDVYCRLTASGLTHAAQGPRPRGRCRPPRRAGIDWIFGTRKVRFAGHTRDASALVRRTTDHPLVVTRARAR
ncbi:MAG: endonuclease/exonuclease/phosphatase family protein [Nocardioidaceae bacterium]